MRDVNAEMGLPTRDELKARIRHPEQYRPEPRLIEPVTWRPLPDGAGEAWNKPKKQWVRVHAIYVEAYKGLEEGLTFQEIVDRAFPKSGMENPRVCARYLRNHLWELKVGGYIDIPLPPLPDLFDGRYRRVKELGRGGMGVAHLCLDEKEGSREVVVKHAWGWHKPIHRAEASIRREAEIMRRFDHPGIAKLLDTFERDGLLHMVREFARGLPLNQMHAALRDAPATTRLRIDLGIAEAVEHMHVRGFLFLDPKPDNYILDGLDGTPLVLDVGICRPHEDGVSQLATPVGSPGYAAPEVFSPEKLVTLRTDVWGVGRAMSAIALGRRTKQRWNHDALVAELRTAGVEGAELDLLSAMTHDDPQDRLPTMGEVVTRLRGALGQV